jgi:hypothetical protein
VVREITIQVHELRLAGLEFAQSFLGKSGELILGGGKCFGPAPVRLQFREKKRCNGILFRVRQLGGCCESALKKLSHGLEYSADS